MAVPLNQPENLLAISHISIISNPTLRLEMEAIDSDSDVYIYIASLVFYFFSPTAIAWLWTLKVYGPQVRPGGHSPGVLVPVVWYGDVRRWW